jgi:hypothetical protein
MEPKVMTKTKAPDKLFLLGSGVKRLLRFGLPVSQVLGRRALVHALGEASPSALWMAAKPGATEELLHEAIRLPARRRSRLGGLLTLYQPRPESIQPLDDLFEPFVWSTDNFQILPLDELAEVLADERRGDLVIGGYADLENQTLTLVRGDLRRLSVPLSMFLPAGIGPAPDASGLEFTDCGNTVRLGEYEAAADAILYDADPDFRSRLLAKRRAEEKTFGACLRRLRLSHGLRQGDFGDVTAKTIARIERGETGAPHGHTLKVIARRLQVDADEITSY